jgi:protein arginine N-methyltransferase 3
MSDEDERWSDWEEDEGVEMPTQSLFGPARTFANPSECIRATRDEHGFDILKAARALGLYERIQLVNYIRARTAEGDAAGALVSAVTAALALPAGRPWKDERFLQPVVEGDPILFSLGELDDDDDDDDNVCGAASADDEALMRSALTTEPSAQLETEPEALAEQMAQMRSLLHELSADAVEPRASTADADESGSDDGGGESGSAAAAATDGGGRRRRKPRTIAEKVDEGYFGSYTELGIHHTMLSDRVRTDAYRRAIQQPWMAGKRVLDIGCGTSILSLFAASAGAEHVYGVDASGIILHAQEVVR